MDLICRAHQVRRVLLRLLNTISPRSRGWQNADLLVCRVAIGGRGRVRVLREATLGHAVLRAQLLRRVRQRWRHDECR